MKQHIENVRRKLGDLDEMSAKTEAAERKILESAETRLEHVQSKLAELRPRALLEAGAGEAYQALLMERQRLGVVIAQAKRILG